MWRSPARDKGLIPCKDFSPLPGLRISVCERATSAPKRLRQDARAVPASHLDSRAVYRTCLDFPWIVVGREDQFSLHRAPDAIPGAHGLACFIQDRLAQKP